MQLPPTQSQQRITGLRLVAGDIEKGEKFGAGHGIFAQGKGPHCHRMLWPFGIKPPRLMRRTAHQEFSRRDADHLRTFRTFLERAIGGLDIAIGSGLRAQKDSRGQGGSQNRGGAEFHGPHQSRNQGKRKPFWPKDHAPL
jgi:hypothetical protein